MGDIMFTVEKIDDNIVVLEDRNKNTFFNIEKNNLPNNIKEGDILDLEEGKYIINEYSTKKIKEDIRNKFNSLMN